MSEEKINICETAIECESPAVHSYLNSLQSVISRMASNSATCKSWCITLVFAIVVALIDKNKAHLVLIAILPTALFSILDCYYLSLEKAFRDKYNNFIKKLHAGNVGRSDLFIISPETTIGYRQLRKSLKSISIYPFYLTVTIMIIFVGFVVEDFSWLHKLQSVLHSLSVITK